MRPGQLLTRWWQDYVAGRLLTPQSIVAAALNEKPVETRFFGIPVDSGTFDAPARLRAPAFISSNPHILQWDRADWANTDPRLSFWAAMLQEAARKQGIPLYVHCALRNRAEQERVYKAGNSKAVYGRSAHNIGEAVDIVHSVFHWEMSRNEWLYLYKLGQLCLDRLNANLVKDRKLSLIWGGHFKSLYDPAHWEIALFRDRLRPLADTQPIRETPRARLQKGISRSGS